MHQKTFSVQFNFLSEIISFCKRLLISVYSLECVDAFFVVVVVAVVTFPSLSFVSKFCRFIIIVIIIVIIIYVWAFSFLSCICHFFLSFSATIWWMCQSLDISCITFDFFRGISFFFSLRFGLCILTKYFMLKN